MARKIIKLFIILIISMLIGNMAYGMYREFKIGDGPSVSYAQVENQIKSSSNMENKIGTNSEDLQEEIVIEKILEEYKGYKVSSKLVIPKIELETYILDSTEEDAMWLCPTKYFGPEPNKSGNYCIAAHNYDKENMFNHIIELERGDKIFLSDNFNGKCTYEIYDIYKVQPSDTRVLSQKTNGETEITLITCSDYSSKRIIVKARKI